jgi:uncharacterized protein (TIGR03067 family)
MSPLNHRLKSFPIFFRQINDGKTGNIFTILAACQPLVLFFIILKTISTMRLMSLFAVLVIGLGCNSTKNAKMNPYALNGTWLPIKQEFAGTQLPMAAFEKQRLTINDKMYTLIAESVDKGELTYSDGKMDIYGKDGVNAGKHFTAIYKYENGQLTICYNLSGNSYPEAFETSGKPTFFLSVFKKS